MHARKGPVSFTRQIFELIDEGGLAGDKITTCLVGVQRPWAAHALLEGAVQMQDAVGEAARRVAAHLCENIDPGVQASAHAQAGKRAPRGVSYLARNDSLIWGTLPPWP